MKVALVHDQLHEFGGAERVFITFKKMFLKADVYTAFYTKSRLEKHAPDYATWNIKESFVSKIPFIHKLYSPLRFLAPLIWESFDFSSYDLVISSSGWYMCKGIKTKKPTIHISYLHHPPRYLYGYETAMEWQKYLLIKIYAHVINHFLRMWDFESSKRPDFFIANSLETKQRIEKLYRRDATVIYPPVSIVQTIDYKNTKLEERLYYVTVCRLQKAKHVEVLIMAANKLKFRLKIVGIGKDEEYLKSIAGPTVEFLGQLPDEDFEKLYFYAKAFLFASVDEEFGIAPIEAMGYGVPVIAYKSGGLIETVKNGENGYLYEELTDNSLIGSINQFESLSSEKYLAMRKSARKESEKYSQEEFEKQFLEFIENHARTTRS